MGQMGRRCCMRLVGLFHQRNLALVLVVLCVTHTVAQNGQQTGTSCRADVLRQPQHGQMDPSDPSQATWTPGSVANFTCDRGFFITFGDKSQLLSEWSMTCLDNGSWTSAAPECKSIPCGKPEDASDNAMVTVTLLSATSANVIYQCNSGYHVKDSIQSIGSSAVRFPCQSGQSWPPASQVPQCKPSSCYHPARGRSPPYLMTLTGNDYTIGQIVTYTCKPRGYVVNGEPGAVTSVSMQCLTSLKWNRTAPAGCRQYDCGAPDTSNSNAEVALPAGTRYGAVATFTCQPWYIRNGSYARMKTATCTLNGWNNSPPECASEIPCENPGLSIAFGKVSGPNSILNASLTYSCIKGFALEEPDGMLAAFRILKCLLTGNWSNVAPEKCIINETVDITPQAAVAIIGDSITLTCHASVDASLLYRWRRQSGAELPENTSVDMATGTLAFVNVTAVDQDGYICQLMSGDEVVPNTVQQTSLTVLKPPTVTIIIASHSPVVVGEPVSLNCTATGSGPFIFHWGRQSNSPLPHEAESNKNTGILLIPSVEFTDADVYECTVTSLAIQKLYPDKASQTSAAVLDVIPSDQGKTTVIPIANSAGQKSDGESSTLYLSISLSGGAALAMLAILLCYGHKAFKKRQGLPANWPRVVRSKSAISGNSGDVIRTASSLSELFDDPIYTVATPREDPNCTSTTFFSNGVLDQGAYLRVNIPPTPNDDTADAHAGYVTHFGASVGPVETGGTRRNLETAHQCSDTESAHGVVTRVVTRPSENQPVQEEVTCGFRSRANTDASAVEVDDEEESISTCQSDERGDEGVHFRPSVDHSQTAALSVAATQTDVCSIPPSQSNTAQFGPVSGAFENDGKVHDRVDEVVYSRVNTDEAFSMGNAEAGCDNVNMDIQDSIGSEDPYTYSSVAEKGEAPYSTVSAEDAYRSINGAPAVEVNGQKATMVKVLANPYAVTDLPTDINGRLNSTLSEETLPTSPLYFEVQNDKSVPIKSSKFQYPGGRQHPLVSEMHDDTLTLTPDSLVLRRSISTPHYFTLENDRSAAGEGSTSGSEYGALCDMPALRVHGRVKTLRQDPSWDVSSDDFSGTETDESIISRSRRAKLPLSYSPSSPAAFFCTPTQKEKTLLALGDQKTFELDQRKPATRAEAAESESDFRKEIGMVFDSDHSGNSAANAAQRPPLPRQQKTSHKSSSLALSGKTVRQLSTIRAPHSDVESRDVYTDL